MFCLASSASALYSLASCAAARGSIGPAPLSLAKDGGRELPVLTGGPILKLGTIAFSLITTPGFFFASSSTEACAILLFFNALLGGKSALFAIFEEPGRANDADDSPFYNVRSSRADGA